MSLLAEFDQRGLIHDVTDRAALTSRLESGPLTVYYGCDPTADSLHIGNLIGLIALRRFQARGHKPIALAGGGTGLIGDPSGKSTERSFLSGDELAQNLRAITEQIQQIVPDATFVNNGDWLDSLHLIDFLRRVGRHVTINQMVAKESVRTRMEGEAGISFTEFSYMLLQAHDFYELHKKYGCEMQIGGSDQWGNITVGLDLVRKRTGASLFGLTWPLITRSDGRKFGKSESGTIWLSPEKTSPFRFFQYWMTVDDRDADLFLRQFTFLDLSSIEDLERETRQAPQRRKAQRTLAREVTKLVHGSHASTTAEAASKILFDGNVTGASAGAFEALTAEIPTVRIPAEGFEKGVELTGPLVQSGLAKSKSEARRSLEQGGIYLNNRRIGPTALATEDDLLHGRYTLLRRGKQNYALILLD